MRLKSVKEKLNLGEWVTLSLKDDEEVVGSLYSVRDEGLLLRSGVPTIIANGFTFVPDDSILAIEYAGINNLAYSRNSAVGTDHTSFDGASMYECLEFLQRHQEICTIAFDTNYYGRVLHLEREIIHYEWFNSSGLLTCIVCASVNDIESVSWGQFAHRQIALSAMS